jgi:hypothetical protein
MPKMTIDSSRRVQLRVSRRVVLGSNVSRFPGCRGELLVDTDVAAISAERCAGLNDDPAYASRNCERAPCPHT